MEGLNPLNWTAGPFLTLYGLLMVALLVGLYAGRGWMGRARDLGGGELGPVELAYLAGGQARAMDTVAVGMFETGVLSVDESGKKYMARGLRDGPEWLRGHGSIEPGPVSRRALHLALRRGLAPMVAGLEARGLVAAAGDALNYYTFGVAFLAVVVGLGVMKIDVGSARGHPVGILTAMVIATVVLGGVVMLRGPRRTRAGTAALRRAKRENARAVRAPVAEEVMLAFALAGTAVLAGRPYQPFFATASGGGGDGGGDGGGGCGGGGCGGCGG